MDQQFIEEKVLKEEKLTKELYEYIIKRMRNEWKYKYQKSYDYLNSLDEIYKLPEARFTDIADTMEIFSIITHEERENYSDTKLPLLAAKISKVALTLA